MQALTAIAATAYAIGLWMFAPRTVWERELATAKRNQQKRLTSTPETTPQPKPETIQTSETKLKSITKDIPESTPQLDATEEPEASAQPSELTPEPETVPTPELKPEPTPQEEQPQIEPIPEAIPQLDATPEATEEPTPQPEPKTVPTPEPKSIPEAIEQAIITPQGTDYTGWTTTQLREEAKQRKLQWRPLINGKRKPLNKPQLIELLTA